MIPEQLDYLLWMSPRLAGWGTITEFIQRLADLGMGVPLAPEPVGLGRHLGHAVGAAVGRIIQGPGDAVEDEWGGGVRYPW
jgi:hypothetical protein